MLRSEHGRRYYPLAVAAVVALSGVMLAFHDELGVLNVLLLSLLLTFALALGFGAGSAALAAVLGFLTFDFVFIPPYDSLSVDRPSNLLALAADSAR